MVNPGAFSGSRKQFLLSCKETYAQAVLDGEVSETIAMIQRRYFLRYPIDLPHDEEPSAEHLASVDDNAAVAEREGPNPDVMSLEEYQEALLQWEEMQKLLLFRKAQIKRWFAYQYMKDMDMDSTKAGAYNPFRALLFKLTGKRVNAPRQLSAANTWRKTQRETVEAVVQSRLKQLAEENKAVPKSRLIAFRDEVARELFQQLPDEQREHWTRVSVEEHKKAKKEWKEEMEAKIGTDPVSRQVAIQGLIKFLQPILDLICEATGWKASLICGGPEPALDGLLNVISIHSGTTSGDIKMGFGKSERAQFRKIVVPLFGQFLQKCYSPVECRARALKKDQGFVPLSELDPENEGASIDIISPSANQPPPIRLGSTLSSTAGVTAAILPTLSMARPQVIPTASTPQTSALARASNDESAASTAKKQSRSSAAAVDTVARQPAATSKVPPTSVQPHRSTNRKSTVQIPPSPGAETSSACNANATSPSSIINVEVAGKTGQTPGASGAADADVEVDVALRMDEGGLQRDQDVEGVNPFPFDISLDSPRPTQAPLAMPSRNTTPLPSPCSSPRPSPIPMDVSNSSPSALPATNLQDGDTIVSFTAPVPPITRSTRSSTRDERGNVMVDNGVKKAGKRGKKRGVDDVLGKDECTAISKRTRANGDRSLFETPNQAPEWFKKAYGMLSSGSGDLGEEWTLLIASWGRFEVEAGYVGQVKLGSTDRPQAIKDWIQRARSPTWCPNIANAAAFGSELKVWWVGIQPEWCVGEDGALLKGGDGDWEGLRRPGVNGLLSVVAALFFWGVALHGKDEDMHQWMEVVADFSFVLSHLTSKGH